MADRFRVIKILNLNYYKEGQITWWPGESYGIRFIQVNHQIHRYL